MQEIKIQRYIFNWVASSKLTFPSYSGSILRGHFGNQLRKVVCFTKQEVCLGCPLINRCSYGRLYETVAQSGGQKQPHPYIIEPLKYGTQVILPERKFSFSMVLIGKDAIEDISLIIFIWEQVFTRGFKHRDNIGSAELINVCLEDGTIIYDNQSEEKTVVSHKTHINISENNIDIPTLHINLLTPLRLQGIAPNSNKSIVIGKNTFDAKCFVQAVLRRCQIVLNQQLGLPISVPKWNDFADNICIDNVRLCWTSTTRFSRRQNQEMDFFGLIGEFDLHGSSIIELYGWLHLCSYLHLGKSSTFGFGKYSMEIESKS